LRILDRRQIEVLIGFTSISRVNVRLAKLRKAGLILRYFTGTASGSRRALYALTKLGATAGGVLYAPLKWRPESTLLGNAFVAHQLALNDIFVATWGRVRWTVFDHPLSTTVPLVPDALVESETQAHFLEVDLGTEPLTVWTRKADLYMKLATSGTFREITSQPRFSVLVITTSEQRMSALRRHILKQTPKLYWFATLEIIMRQGFWSSVWLRPHGDNRSPPGE